MKTREEKPEVAQLVCDGARTPAQVLLQSHLWNTTCSAPLAPETIKAAATAAATLPAPPLPPASPPPLLPLPAQVPINPTGLLAGSSELIVIVVRTIAGLSETYNPYETLFLFLLVCCYYLSMLDTQTSVLPQEQKMEAGLLCVCSIFNAETGLVLE